jgi:tRNA pseudouridine13 synthase
MPTTFALTPPLLTADLPGVGGKIKVFPEDFEVEEIPAYEPSGSGDFLYLWMEKRDMGAEYFARQIAKRLGITAGEVGTAGLKDRRAIARQMVSIPAHLEERLSQLDGDGIRILRVSRHGNKLRPGHLHGNRFRVLVRDVDPSLSIAAVLPPLLGRLRSHGLPNYYGLQRFGKESETLHIGLALLQKSERMSSMRNRFLRKLALSAVQAGLFNHYLGTRQADGQARQVLLGDVMAKVPFGGMFLAENVMVEQKRLDAGETVPAGPIFGRKMFRAAHDAARREEAALAAFGLTRDDFGAFGKLLQGTRRHNLVYVADLATAEVAEGMLLTFTLPAGSYATVLLREIMKTEAADEDVG